MRIHLNLKVDFVVGKKEVKKGGEKMRLFLFFFSSFPGKYFLLKLHRLDDKMQVGLKAQRRRVMEQGIFILFPSRTNKK